MQKLFFKSTGLLFVIAIVYACSPKESTKNAEVANNIPSYQCYLFSLNNDTVSLQLKDSNSIITGNLNYLPYEKDGTIGNLHHIEKKGDTLFALYTSMQEGQESTGEFAMLKVDKNYVLTNDIWGVENYTWDSTYANGKFKNKHTVQFDGDTLKHIECGKLKFY